MLINLLVAISVGSVMGILMHAKKHRKIKKPRNTKLSFHLGVLEEMLWGAAAATLLVLISEPSDWWRAVFLGIIGGYGGESVVRQHEYNNAQTKLEYKQKNEQMLEEELNGKGK
jgi:hypothetical protein